MLVWHIGDVIRKVREKKKLTRKAVVALVRAMDTGDEKPERLRPNTLGKLEADSSNFRRGTLLKVAKALGTTPERLWQQIPHAPEACSSDVTPAVRLPDDDQSRALAKVWLALLPEDRQFVITVATHAANARGDAGKEPGYVESGDGAPTHGAK